MSIRSTSRCQALRLGTALATCVLCCGQGQTAFGQAVTDLPVLKADGGASINNSLDGKTKTVDLLNANRVITWNQFSIDKTFEVNFKSTVVISGDLRAAALSVLNRVTGDSPGNSGNNTTFYPSLINGKLTGEADIAIWLVNPAGITFGPTGSFSGGSLILSTLDVPDNASANLGSSINFTSRTDLTTGNNSVGTNLGAKAYQLNLASGVSTADIKSSGNVLLIGATAGDVATNGRGIEIGKNITASGTVSVIAVSDVTFGTGVNSPLNYTINAGALVTGVRVLGTATIKGSNIVLAAKTAENAINDLLMVGSGSTLQVDQSDGMIRLVVTTFAATPGTPNQLTADGTLNSAGDVTVSADGNAAITGAVTAGKNYAVTAADITLGSIAAVTQSAGLKVAITSANGTITGGSGLVLKSNDVLVAAQDLASTLILDAGTGTLDLDRGSSLSSGNAATGVRFGAANALKLGNVTSGHLGNYDPAVPAIQLDLKGDDNFTAGTITTENSITAAFGKTIDITSVKTTISTSDVSLTAGNDIKLGSAITRSMTLSAGTELTSNGSTTLGTATLTGGISGPGLLKSTTGDISLIAGGSVLGPASIPPVPSFTIGAGGIAAYESTGNLTVTADKDLAVGSLKAGGTLDLAVGGSLYGLAQSTTAVPGGALIAQGAGNVTVNANTTDGAINLNRVQVDTGTISLTANKVAVGTIETGTGGAYTPGSEITAASYYLGLRKFNSDATLTLLTATDTFADTDALASPTKFFVDPMTLTAGRFGKATTLTAGKSVLAKVVDAAQLGTVTGGDNVRLDTGAVFATSVTATGTTPGTVGYVDVIAQRGTLDVATANAKDYLSLVKKGGNVDVAGNPIPDGNTLRFGTIIGGNGSTDPALLALLAGERFGVVVDSATSVLGNSATARLGSAVILARSGDIAGKTQPRMDIFATGAATTQNVYVRAARQALLGTVDGRNRVSLVGGAKSLTEIADNPAGYIDVTTAIAGDSLYLTTLNNAAGTPARGDIVFGSLTARGGDVVAVTAGSNRGDLSGRTITAGRDALADARNITIGSATANTRDIALKAAGSISATTLDAFRTIAGLAGTTIDIGTARAQTGDLALQAGGVLTLGTGEAFDDALLTGSSVRLGTVSITGTTAGTQVNDPDFANLTSIGDPTFLPVTGTVPTVVGTAPGTTGHSIVVRATTGDVTGLALDPLVTPLLGLVTTADQLSIAYGKANLTTLARDGAITVEAFNGGAQLGTLLQGTGLDPVSAMADIAVTARAISADRVVANTGNATLRATAAFAAITNPPAKAGTLVLGTGSAFKTISLVKEDGSLITAGDTLRFGTIIGGNGSTDPALLALLAGERFGVVVDSATSVLGNSATARLGSAVILARSGDIAGKTQPRMDIFATGAATTQNVYVRAARQALLGTVDGRNRVSLVGGAKSLTEIADNPAGYIDVTTAIAGDSLYLTTLNNAAGTPARGDIVFGSLTARGGDVVAVTAGSNRGDLSGRTITAGRDALADARNITIGSATANTRDIALKAAGSISATTLDAFRTIAGLAGTTIDIGTARAQTGDLALQAGGVLTLGTGEAFDDALLTGSSVRLGTVSITGTTAGTQVNDPDFANLTSIGDPTFLPVTGTVPTVVGTAPGTTGHSIVVRATTGDVTGLALDPLVTPLLGLVTTADQLSIAYGKANLTTLARDGAITVEAFNGGAQLGTLLQGTGLDPVSAMADIAVTARAISADRVVANTGNATLRATAAFAAITNPPAKAGTLVVANVTALKGVTLVKQDGSVTAPGDELRFRTITTTNTLAPAPITVTSATNVRGDTIAASDGDVRVDAGLVSDAITQAGQITSFGFNAEVPRALSISSGATGRILTRSGALSQLGALTSGGDISVVAGTLAAPFNGAVRLDRATSSAGSIYLTNKNTVAGTQSSIGFTSLDAKNDVILITSTGNGGDVLGGTVIAGRDIFAGANDVRFTSLNAGRDIGVDAVREMTGGSIDAGGGIGARAGSLIAVGDVTARGSDVAMRTLGTLTTGAVTGADDVRLTGTSVIVTSADAQGTGFDGDEVDLASSQTASNPYDPGFGFGAPLIHGAKANTGGNLVITATTGNIAVANFAGAQADALLGAKLAIAVPTAKAGGSLALNAGTNVNSSVELTAREDVGVLAGGTATLKAVTAGDDLKVDTGANLTIDSATVTGAGIDGRSIVFGTAPTVTVGMSEAAVLVKRNLLLTSNNGDVTVGALTLRSAPKDGKVAVTAVAGAVTVSRDVAVDGIYAANAKNDITLGDSSTRIQAASGAVAITSTAGAIRQGTGTLQLVANSDGAGIEPLALSAKTDIALGKTDFLAGTSAVLGDGSVRQSPITISAETGSATIGTLNFSAPATIKFDAKNTRIDVVGKISLSGTSKTLRMGGTDGAAADLASVIRVAAKGDGSGGSIAAVGGAVDMRGAGIGFGLDTGFLSAIGLDSGTGDSTVARDFNNRANSPLYNALAGQGIYLGNGVKLLTADTLKITFTNFALFQNTSANSLVGETSGVDLATGLTLSSPSTQPIFGFFGTIAGRERSAAALLGSLAIGVGYGDRSSSRINGCIIGESGGCLSTQPFTPNLSALDAVRTNLFQANRDFILPFNPLIGTNNDSLFGDVGSFGLDDADLLPIECSEPNREACPDNKKGNK